MRPFALFCLVAGCANDTKVILTVMSDGVLAIPDEVDELHLQIQEEVAPGQLETVHDQDHLRLCQGGEGCYPLPLTAALVPGPKRPDSTIVVTVEARRAGNAVIRDVATFKFVPGSTERLQFVLRPQCLGSNCAAVGQACSEAGVCAPLTVSEAPPPNPMLSLIADPTPPSPPSTSPSPSLELGIFTDGACDDPADEIVLHQGLDSPACGGCSCHVKTTCGISIVSHNEKSCLDGPGWNLPLSVASEGTTTCFDSPIGVDPAAVKLIALPKPVPDECIADTGASAPTPTWQQTRRFCRQTGGQCIRIPSADALCPAEFPHSQGNWYSSFTPQVCSCGACAVDSQGECPTALTTSLWGFGESACGGDSVGKWIEGDVLGQCIEKDAAHTWQLMMSFRFEHEIRLQKGSCTRPTLTDQPAQAQGASTICCAS